MSLHDRPTVGEILQAVRVYLTDEVAKTSDRRDHFRALIAANVLGVAERELELAEQDARAEDESLGALGLSEGTADERRRKLCTDIRAGAYDRPQRFGPVLAYAAAMVERKLAVSNPRYVKGRI